MNEKRPGALGPAADQLEPFRIEATEPERPKSDPMAEITAMTEVAKVLTPLSPDSVRRVLSWAADTFQASVATGNQKTATSDFDGGMSKGTPSTEHPNDYSFEEIGEVFAVAQPKSDAEKALLVAYWFQSQGDQNDFDSASVNRELKHLGHGSSNITNALSSLITRKPQLVIQTRKSGKSQQARKKYKLTNEGVKVARMMLNGEEL